MEKNMASGARITVQPSAKSDRPIISRETVLDYCNHHVRKLRAMSVDTPGLEEAIAYWEKAAAELAKGAPQP